MEMKNVNEFLPIKFLIVLGKLNASVFGTVNKHIKDIGFNTTEFLIMYAIASNGALTVQDIASRITVTSGNMTYTVDKLEEKELVKRVRCDEDRRKVFIDFTDKGKDVWSETISAHMDYMKEAFEAVDDETIEETIQYMKVIGRMFDKDNQ